jgi:hypothetical protein
MLLSPPRTLNYKFFFAAAANQIAAAANIMATAVLVLAAAANKIAAATPCHCR